MKEILVVSFGTSYDKARHSIEAVEKKIKLSFPQYSIRRAFTSGMIIKKLASRGIIIDNVQEALAAMANRGVREVIVQPTHLIEGIEYEKLLAAVKEKSGEFERIKIGRPLLATSEDIAVMAGIINCEIPREKGECLVLMGHGTEHSANSVYADVQAEFDKIASDVFVGTIEGYPGIEDLLKSIAGYNKVVIAPLMLVAGDHAINDMAGEDDSWKTILEEQGFSVRTILKGLGEYPQIQDMYAGHAREASYEV